MARGNPVSLVLGDTASARRARAGVDVTGSPDAEPDKEIPGFETRGARWIHITISLPDTGTSLSWQFWLWDERSEKWMLDTRLGTGGTVALAESDDDQPQYNIIEVAGVNKVWVRLFNGAGTFTEGADVWLAGANQAVV